MSKGDEETKRLCAELERAAKELRASLPPLLHNLYLDSCLKFTPGLLPIYLTLQPFADVIDGYTFGPQPQALDYDPEEPPYMLVRVCDPRYPGSEDDGTSIEVRITAESATVHWYCMNGAGGENYADENEIELSGLWDYLRQIPRPYDSFLKRSPRE